MNIKIAKIKKEKITYVDILNPDNIITKDLPEYLTEASNERYTTYIHNLAVEGSMLTPFLLKNGYTHTNSNPNKKHTFKKIEGDDGSIFSIILKVDKGNKSIKFIDSKKILNFKPEELKKDFLESTEEMDDLTIVSKSLKIMFDEGHTSDTMSANAWSFFKMNKFGKDESVSNKSIRNILPKISIEADDFIRTSYIGGWVYLNPNHNKMKKSGITLDVNSLFPSVMYDSKMPWGIPIHFKGEYKEDTKYPLYIQKMKVDWVSLKPNKLPFINHSGVKKLLAQDYVVDETNLTLCLTNVDFELFKECYDFGSIEYIEGYKFRSTSNLFKSYVEHFSNIKKVSKGAKRQIAKLFLNSLYGKFGSKVRRRRNNYILDSEGKEIKVLECEELSGEMYYTAISSFICSYARAITIRGANANYDNFIYADTDSLHLDCSVDEVKDLIIDSKELGCWKVEKEFTDSVYLGLKCYGELDEKGWEFKAAGLPKEAQELIKDKDKFFIGSEIKCNVRKKTVNGIEFIERIFRLSASKIGKI